jgi:hypothetical protein
MVAVIGIFGVLSGALLACASKRFPAYMRALEIGAGFLLIGGLALASRALPIVL